MPEFQVTLKWSVRYTYTVTADSDDDAEQAALDLWAQDDMSSDEWRANMDAPMNDEPDHVEVVPSA